MEKKNLNNKFQSLKKRQNWRIKNNKKYILKSGLSPDFNKTNKYFEHFSDIFKNDSLYKFLDYYNVHNNYLKKVNTNTNYNTLIHKSYFLINSKNININQNIFDNFNTNINIMNKLFLSRENIELGYNDNTLNNLNNKYSTYYYTKLFRLKINDYKQIERLNLI